MSKNIAIDGPAGAGKSTIARTLARQLNYIYVDTGAMYRAMALYMLETQVDISDSASVNAACDNIKIDIEYANGIQYVYLNGRNVNDFIRTEPVSQMSSKISTLPVVREKLLSLQRSLASNSDVIMDGRDIGTHVLPNADVKIYLTAGSHIRALRRYKELSAKGESCNLEMIEKEIIERDRRDMNRAVAPLKQAEDAVLVDTSDLTIEEVVSRLNEIIADRI
jgi:cytidylate kinase